MKAIVQRPRLTVVPSILLAVCGALFERTSTVCASAQCPSWIESSQSTFGSASAQSLWGFAYHDADGAGPQPTRLYASGTFRTVNGNGAAGIAVFENDAWRALGLPADSIDSRWLFNFDHDGDPITPAWLLGLARRGPDMLSYPLVARWTGSTWEGVGDLTRASPGVWGDAEVTFAAQFDDDGAGPNPPALFIAGGPQVPVSIGSLRGEHWEPLPGVNPFGNGCYALLEFDADDALPQPPMLIAQGLTGFLVRIARNGWSYYGNGMTVSNAVGSSHFRCNPIILDTDGPGPRSSELVVGATRINTAQGAFFGAAAFNGSTWRSLGPANPANFPTQPFRSAWAIDVDGPGPGGKELILCGTINVQWLHRGSWVTIPIVATGVAGYKEGVEGPAPNELWFAGAFNEAGGLPATGFAKCRLIEPIAVDSRPASQSASRTGSASFTVIARGDSPQYQWRRNGLAIIDGPGGASPNGGLVSGANENTLTLSNIACSDAGTYECVVSNYCGSTTGLTATLTVLSSCCPTDLDNDGAVDIADLLVFLAAFEAGSSRADLDNDGDPSAGVPDGATTIDDLLFFLTHFEQGC
jgi:Immunoglobulin domain